MGKLLQKALEQEEGGTQTDLGREDNINSRFPSTITKKKKKDNDIIIALRFFPAYYFVVHSSSWSLLQLSPELLCHPFYFGRKHSLCGGISPP